MIVQVPKAVPSSATWPSSLRTNGELGTGVLGLVAVPYPSALNEPSAVETNVPLSIGHVTVPGGEPVYSTTQDPFQVPLLLNVRLPLPLVIEFPEMWTVQVSVPAVGVLLPLQAQKTDANPNAIFAKDFIAALVFGPPRSARLAHSLPVLSESRPHERDFQRLKFRANLRASPGQGTERKDAKSSVFSIWLLNGYAKRRSRNESIEA